MRTKEEFDEGLSSFIDHLQRIATLAETENEGKTTPYTLCARAVEAVILGGIGPEKPRDIVIKFSRVLLLMVFHKALTDVSIETFKQKMIAHIPLYVADSKAMGDLGKDIPSAAVEKRLQLMLEAATDSMEKKGAKPLLLFMLGASKMSDDGLPVTGSMRISMAMLMDMIIHRAVANMSMEGFVGAIKGHAVEFGELIFKSAP